MITPQEAYKIIPTDELLLQEKEYILKMSKQIIDKVELFIKHRKFFFNTREGDKPFHIGFSPDKFKENKAFDIAIDELKQNGWEAGHQMSSCGYGGYHLLWIYSKDFNAGNIKFTTSNDLNEFIY